MTFGRLGSEGQWRYEDATLAVEQLNVACWLAGAVEVDKRRPDLFHLGELIGAFADVCPDGVGVAIGETRAATI